MQLIYSIHPEIHNKPPHWQPSFASSWAGQEAGLEQLKAHVSSGGAFIPARLTSEHRSSSAFDAADLAVVDIDNGLSIEAFLAHPLAIDACWVYTTASHDPASGKERFRVVFRLPRRISDPDLYKAVVTLLSRSLGGDRSCTDPCRLFYGNDAAEHPLWQPDAQLPDSLLDDADQEAQQQRRHYDRQTADYDEGSIERAVFVLEQIIEPTSDGQRDRFIRVTAAARSAGDRLFSAWSDWASRGHHGKGKNARQTSERFFRGLNGTSLGSLFVLASEDDPDWRQKLPDEIRNAGGESKLGIFGHAFAGYAHEDFLGDPDDEPVAVATRTQSLFDEERPWTQIAVVAPPPPQPSPAAAPEPELLDDGPDHGYDDGDHDDDDQFDEPGEPVPRVRRGGRPRANADNETVDLIKNRLQRLYPGLRLNAMSQQLEYGPKERPLEPPDISTAYVRISRGAGQVFSKTLTYDTAMIIGQENQYHPVRAYLERCVANVAPCPYFDTMATELLGLPEEEGVNPRMPGGSRVADQVLKRFMIGAVARVFEPGCTHDWMPILIGPQNAGKTTFFQYLTPPSPADPGNYPWVSTMQQGINYIKDRPHVLHAGWIVVLDEVERYFKRQTTEEFKNLVSCSTDRSARKYENERNFKRAFVLAGATNSDDFLVDPTGNRRFMPITVTGKVPSRENPRIRIIDLDRLKADRDSLWAAAYQAYLDNPVHTFSSYELSCISEYVDSYTFDNPLEEPLLRELERNHSGWHMGEVYWTLSDLFKWMEIPLRDHKTMTPTMTDILKRHGYRNKRARVGKRERRIWVGPKSTLNGETDGQM